MLLRGTADPSTRDSGQVLAGIFSLEWGSVFVDYVGPTGAPRSLEITFGLNQVELAMRSAPGSLPPSAHSIVARGFFDTLGYCSGQAPTYSEKSNPSLRWPPRWAIFLFLDVTSNSRLLGSWPLPRCCYQKRRLWACGSVWGASCYLVPAPCFIWHSLWASWSYLGPSWIHLEAYWDHLGIKWFLEGPG